MIFLAEKVKRINIKGLLFLLVAAVMVWIPDYSHYFGQPLPKEERTLTHQHVNSTVDLK
jgi:hypothetical protein